MIIIVAISGSAKIRAHDRSRIFPSAEEPKSCVGLLRILVRGSHDLNSRLDRTAVSVIARGRRRSVRPLGHRNNELGHWLRIAIKVWTQQNREVSAKRACTPSVSIFHGNIKQRWGAQFPHLLLRNPCFDSI